MSQARLHGKYRVVTQATEGRLVDEARRENSRCGPPSEWYVTLHRYYDKGRDGKYTFIVKDNSGPVPDVLFRSQSTLTNVANEALQVVKGWFESGLDAPVELQKM